MIDFIGRRRIYALVSLLMLTPALIGLAIWQFEAGLDFAGGLESEVRFVQDVSVADVEALIAGVELPEGATTSVGEGEDGKFELAVQLAADDDVALDEAMTAIRATLSEELGRWQTEGFSSEPDRATWQAWFPLEASQDQVRAALETVDLGGARIQATADAAFRIRVEQPEDGDLERLRQRINGALRSEIGPIVVLQSASVSGVLSVEIARDAGWRWRSRRWRF